MIGGVDISKFTPTERKIFERLCDGLIHASDSLVDCLFDDLSSKGTVAYHVCNLRKKIPNFLVIHHVKYNGRGIKGYQLLRHLNQDR